MLAAGLLFVLTTLLATAAEAQTPTTLAGEPTNLGATTIGKTRNRLSWTAPADTGGADVAITGYKIEYSAPDHLLPSDTNVWEVLEVDTGSASTTYDHDHELGPGVRLEYRVSAINALGAGDASNVDDATTPAAPDTAGNGAPEHTRSTVNHRRVEIAFDENLDTGSVPRRSLFQVTINGSIKRPETVDVMDAAVVLTLAAADAVDADDGVRLRYTPPVAQIGDALVPVATEALQDLEGNLVESWGHVFPVNETPLPGVTVAPTALTVLEGGSETYTVVLDSAPDAPVTIDIASGGDVSVNPASLTFATTGWEMAQTVTVSAAQDEDEEDDSVTLVHTAKSADQDYESVDVPSVAVTVEDDDALAGEPTNLGATTIGKTRNRLSWTAPADTGGADVAITGYKIEYSAPDHLLPSDTNVWEVLEVDTGSASTTYDHDHELGPGVRLEYRVSAINALGAGDASNVDDATTPAAPDTAGNGAPEHTRSTVNHRRVEIAFDENLDTGSVPRRSLFQVTINGSIKRPETVDVMDAAVVLTLAAADAVDADDGVRLRYTPPVAQIGDALVPVATEALQDLEGNLVESWGHVFPVNETPLPGVTVAPTALTVLEGGSETYTVVLDSAPDAPVTIDIASGGDVSVNPASLTFATTGWEMAQTVTVSAAQDEDEEDDSVTLVHTAKSADQDYESVDVPSVAVTVEDDDALAGEPTNLGATTIGKTRNRLSWTAPADTGGADVAITGYKIEYSAPDHLLPSDTNVWEVLEVDTGSASTTYDHDHELGPGVRLEYRVSAINALGAGDASNVDDATTPAAPDTAGNGAPEHTRSTVNHRRVEIAFDENLDTGSVPRRSLFQVTINGSIKRPETVDVMDAAVVLTLAAADAVDADDGVRLRYTPPVAQIGDALVPVATEALQDLEGNLVESWGHVFPVNETPLPGVTVAPTALTVLEGGSETYTVVLDSAPDAPVTIDIASGGDVSVNPASLTFATTGWEMAQTVTVSAAQDEDEEDDSVTLVHTAKSADQDYESVDVPSVAVTVEDDDALARMTLSERLLEIDEGGSETYTAVLDAEPEDDVVIGIYVEPFSNPGFTLEPANPSPAPPDFPLSRNGSFDTLTFITFTTADWNVAQPVTVQAPAADADGTEESAYVQHVVDPGDGSLRMLAGLTVKATDPDAETGTPAVEVSTTDLTVPRGGTGTYRLGMSGDHTGNVFVNIESSDPGVRVSPATVQFNRGNWDFEQHVKVSVSNGASDATLTHSIDADRTTGDVQADIDSVAVTVGAKPSLSVADAEATEGDPVMEFVVTLDSPATATITVDYATADGTATAPADYVATRGTLTFDAGDGEKTVEVPIHDDRVEDDAETFTVVLSNASRASIADGEATGTIRNTETVAGPPVENSGATGAPTISGTAQVDETLTAAVSGISDADGLENVSYEYQWVRGHTDIGGATDSTYTLVEADAGETIKVRVSFTDDAGHAESLTSVASDAVAAAPEPLTASFSGVPAEHTGEGRFTFDLTFSEDVAGLSFRTLRDEAFDVSGGAVRRAKRKQSGSNLGWTIHVEPAAHDAVTIRLPAGSVETADGRALSHSLSATVAGPAGLSVADAEAEENVDQTIDFTVTLDRAAAGTVTVDYATADGSATAGADYTAASGTLTFQAGERTKTVAVTLLDDTHDEGEETFTLRLSNASGAVVTDGEATGTIENHDPLPRALLARFGRAAAVHVVEHVEERLQAPREPGVRGRFAGRELRKGMERDIALRFLRRLGGAVGMNPAGGSHAPMSGMAGGGAGMGLSASGMRGAGAASFPAPGLGGGGIGMAGAGPTMGGGMGRGSTGAGAGSDGLLTGRGLLRMGLGGGDILTGSAVAVNRETKSGGILSFWSRGAQSHFAGREGALSLGGDVRTTMVGADYAKGPLVAGLSLSHSRGLGEYAGVTGGQVASSVTGLYPWLGYEVTERVTVWGVAGYGAGGLRLTPDGGPALTSGLSMAMAAAGTRGELVAGGAGGFALAFKADALWVGTAIDGVDGAAGRLAATEAAVTRVRTGLEGSRAYTLAGRLSLRPSVEVGLRHDGGDAETGAGLDVGGGLVVSDPSTGLAVDVRVRTLLVHQAEGFRERGLAISLSYTPTPSTPLGLTARVAPSWGGEATSGAEALWGRETMAGLAPGGVADGTRLDAELGYGLAVGRRFVGTPTLGVGTSADGRDYRLGYRLGALGGAATAVELGVDAQRRERPLQGGTDHGALARATLRW